MLDVLLTLDCCARRVVFFEINQVLHVVSLGEALGEAFAMLVRPANQVARDANVQRAARAVSQNVDPITHFKMMDCRVKPGNDDVAKFATERATHSGFVAASSHARVSSSSEPETSARTLA